MQPECVSCFFAKPYNYDEHTQNLFFSGACGDFNCASKPASAVLGDVCCDNPVGLPFINADGNCECM